MTAYDYYLHPANFPSKWAVLDVGLKCMHSCKFCYYSFLNGEDDQFTGMRHAEFHSKEGLVAVLDSMAANGFNGFDVTGGEPCLHPNMAELIKHASDVGLSSRIITLGQYLMRPMHKSPNILLDDLLNAGLTNFLFSCHDVNEERFKTITGGSYAKLKEAMDELDRRDFHYCSNTTVFEENYKHLPEIAEALIRHKTYLHNFILMNAYYEWSDAGRAAPVQAAYDKVYPYLKEAVKILDKAGVGVNIRYAPLCTMPGLEKHIVGVVGVRYDPYEWQNAIDHKADPAKTTLADYTNMGRRLIQRPFTPSAGYEFHYVQGMPKWWGMRGQGAKVFSQDCSHCKAVSVCDGFDPRYAEERKPAMIPYTEVRGEIIQDDKNGTFASALDKERVNYRAPFLVKMRPDAKMKAIVKNKISPEPLPEFPSVAIIIPCYNQGKYVERAIKSALAQTYPNIQALLVDDASSDDTLEIGKRFSDPRFHIVARPENGGQPAITRNTGIEKTKADLILCLDADDWIEPTMVEECVDILKKNPQASIATPGCYAHGKTNGVWEQGEWKYQNHIFQNQFVYCSLYKREVWERVGGYAENVKGCEDFDFWLKAASLGYEAVPVRRALFHYRENNEGLFESEVVPNFEKKYRQIILNRPEPFPPQMVAEAKAEKPITRMIA